MRQEIKLIILVFLLVVGPAIAVSLLSARVLGSWQIVLQKRMEADAARLLDQVVQTWERELLELKAPAYAESPGHEAVSAMARLTLSHPWVAGVFMLRPGGALVYPPEASSHPLGTEPPSPPAVLPGAGYQDARRLLEQPGLDPATRDTLLLRLGGSCLISGDTNQAVALLSQFMKRDPGTISRSNGEGFHLDLVALETLAAVHAARGAAGEERQVCQELLRRVLLRFDDLPALQQDLLVAWIGERGYAFSQVSPVLMAEWRERLRGRALNREMREQLARELSLLVPASPAEFWSRGKAGGQDYLVASPGATGSQAALPVLVLQFSEAALIQSLGSLALRSASNSDVRVECLAGESGRAAGGDRQAPRLASRRLPSPFERIALVATPADPRAFFVNARLQSSLYRWGGLLLIISIVAGVWLIWRQAASEIRQARERSSFAATVSHDLRTPLASMRMLAESLYMGNVSDEAKKQKFLGAIIKESDRLSRLTDRALYFIRYGQNALRYRFTEGDLGALLQGVIEVFAVGTGAEVVHTPGLPATLPGAGHVCIVFPPPGDVPPVQFDGGAMEQVVFNLLDNAVKYSDRAKGALIEVSLALQPAHAWSWTSAGGGPRVVLAVRDHGLGMSRDDVRRILRPYARGRGAATQNARGIGLGLALCHHVVQAHGGTIEVESLPGQGSTFRVVMPVG